jgi:hypothetical protein
MNLELSDEEAAALAQELHEIVENDRYPFSLSRSNLRCSPRIRTPLGLALSGKVEGFSNCNLAVGIRSIEDIRNGRQAI